MSQQVSQESTGVNVLHTAYTSEVHGEGAAMPSEDVSCYCQPTGFLGVNCCLTAESSRIAVLQLIPTSRMLRRNEARECRFCCLTADTNQSHATHHILLVTTSQNHILPTPAVQVQGAAMPTEQVSYESTCCLY